MEIVILIISNVIALATAVFALFQTQAAKRAVNQANLLSLFSTFNQATQLTIENPQILYSVHGIDNSIPKEEAINICYFALLLNAFQNFYNDEFKGDFKEMLNALKAESTFLNKILTIKENKSRWEVLKEFYYGDFDAEFVQSIDSLIEHENHTKV